MFLETSFTSAGVAKAQKALKDALPQQEAFRGSFRSKHEAVRESSKRRRVSGKVGGSVKLPDGDISQPQAKQLLPPRTHIWRDRIRGGWHGHREGFARVPAPWSQHGGERGALLACLRGLWAQHLEAEGLEESTCPIAGLFSGRSAVHLPGIAASSGKPS